MTLDEILKEFRKHQDELDKIKEENDKIDALIDKKKADELTDEK